MAAMLKSQLDPSSPAIDVTKGADWANPGKERGSKI
jgi:hypothetical protein